MPRLKCHACKAQEEAQAFRNNTASEKAKAEEEKRFGPCKANNWTWHTTASKRVKGKGVNSLKLEAREARKTLKGADMASQTQLFSRAEQNVVLPKSKNLCNNVQKDNEDEVGLEISFDDAQFNDDNGISEDEHLCTSNQSPTTRAGNIEVKGSMCHDKVNTGGDVDREETYSQSSRKSTEMVKEPQPLWDEMMSRQKGKTVDDKVGKTMQQERSIVDRATRKSMMHTVQSKRHDKKGKQKGHL